MSCNLLASVSRIYHSARDCKSYDDLVEGNSLRGGASMTLYIPAGRPQGSPPRSTPPPPLQLDLAGDASFVFIVRAGAVWSGVGTLAVALAAPCSLWTFKLP